VIHGTGAITDAHTVVVSDGSASARVLTAEVIVISTGTRSYHPPHVPFDNRYIYDAESIIDLDVLPRSLTIVGGGVIGCEYASIFTHLGVKVTVVDPRRKLLSFLDHEIADALSYLMRKYGITLVLGDAVEQIQVGDDQTVAITKSGRKIVSDRLLFAAGRCGNTENLGLEAVGIEVDDRLPVACVGFDGPRSTGGYSRPEER
jgi:NAD(P) transhydrogenase